MKQYLSLSVTPTSAQIKINGETCAATDGKLIKLLEIGTYEVEVIADKYQEFKQDIKISADEAAKLEINLKPIFNTLALTSSPSEAEVWINGIQKGYSPLTLKYMDSGSYQIELRKNEFKTFNKRIQLGEGENEKLHFDLEELPGSINVNVIPHGSKIYIDGNFAGVSPLKIENLARGKHTLKLTSPSGEWIEEVISISGGGVLQYSRDIPHAALTEYSYCKIGDYFYSDGSFSHALNPNKQPIGIIFSLSTTEEEQARGWTHGQFVALRDHEQRVAWANNGSTLSGYQQHDSMIRFLKRHAYSRANGLLDKNGYLHLMGAKADDISNHPAFDVCINYVPKKNFFEKRVNSEKFAQLPKGITSGWYLPSAGQWADIVENLGNTKLRCAITGGFICPCGKRRLKKLLKLTSNSYWTSVLYDSENSWSLCLDPLGIDFVSHNSSDTLAVRPVAAF